MYATLQFLKKIKIKAKVVSGRRSGGTVEKYEYAKFQYAFLVYVFLLATFPNRFRCDSLYNFLKDEIWNFVPGDNKVTKFSKAK
jgi:hypothetical protein